MLIYLPVSGNDEISNATEGKKNWICVSFGGKNEEAMFSHARSDEMVSRSSKRWDGTLLQLLVSLFWNLRVFNEIKRTKVHASALGKIE